MQRRHLTWKLIYCVCQIHSNCFPIRNCPLVQIVDFLLFAVYLKPSHGCLDSYLFFLDRKKMHMWRECTAELLINRKRFLRHLSRSFFLQRAPFKRLSGRTRKRRYHIWYFCCGIWIFLWKIPSFIISYHIWYICCGIWIFCGLVRGEKKPSYAPRMAPITMYELCFFWRKERNSFPLESCQIASWTHVAKESSWVISINRKYIFTLDPFLATPLCNAWMNAADSYSVTGC